MRPSRLIPTMFFALVLAAFATAAAPPAAQLEWPGTEIAGRARAWFAQLAGSEEEARRFFAEHLAPSALAEAGVDVRMERRHGMIERTGGLTPLEVVDRAIRIASIQGVVLVSYGDMLRVPGSSVDLFSVRAKGGDVRVVVCDKGKMDAKIQREVDLLIHEKFKEFLGKK